MTTIAEVRTRLLTRQMARPWVPQAPRMHLVAVQITDSEGLSGTGFSWTPTIGPQAVQALIEYDIAGFIMGRSSEPTQLWDPLWEHLHEAGGGGLTVNAMAGVDLALWDLKARRADSSLAGLLGRQHHSLPTYGSGVNLHYSLDELGQQLQRWVEVGHTAVKIKVGSSELRRDVERVRLAREILGPDRVLMIDANQRWSLDAADAAVTELAEFDLGWIEEPLRADDTDGYAQLAQRFARNGPRVPIAAGENFHTIYRFREVIAAQGAQVLQPNVIRVGGITAFLRIAALVRESGLRLAPHLLPDISGQLAVTLQGQVWIEDVEGAGFDALGFLICPSPVHIDNAVLTVAEAAGIGLDFPI